MPTVSLVTIKFQLASTALTVTVKAAPAVCAVGAPVLPLAVPGAAVSPGTSNWSLARAPAFTEMAGLVQAVFGPSGGSVTGAVQLPAGFFVRVKGFGAGGKGAMGGRGGKG